MASLVSYVAGETIAISVQPFTTTHLVINVYGFFADAEELANFNTAQFRWKREMAHSSGWCS